jgi:hypothetical protein
MQNFRIYGNIVLSHFSSRKNGFWFCFHFYSNHRVGDGLIPFYTIILIFFRQNKSNHLYCKKRKRNTERSSVFVFKKCLKKLMVNDKTIDMKTETRVSPRSSVSLVCYVTGANCAKYQLNESSTNS